MITDAELTAKIREDYSGLKSWTLKPLDLKEWYRDAMSQAETTAGRAAASSILVHIEEAREGLKDNGSVRKAMAEAIQEKFGNAQFEAEVLLSEYTPEQIEQREALIDALRRLLPGEGGPRDIRAGEARRQDVLHHRSRLMEIADDKQSLLELCRLCHRMEGASALDCADIARGILHEIEHGGGRI